MVSSFQRALPKYGGWKMFIVALAGLAGVAVFGVLFAVMVLKGGSLKIPAIGMAVCFLIVVAIGAMAFLEIGPFSDGDPTADGIPAPTGVVETDNAGESEQVETQAVVSAPEPSLEPDEIGDAEQTAPINSNLIGTSLFEEVYVPFALWEKARVFEAVKDYAQNCGYKYEIIEASESAVASAKFYSGDDYVYVAYAPDVENIEIMMIVSYYQGSSNSEVSMSNYSTGRNRAYDKFQTHVIGEQSNDVEGINDQREFLFSD